MEFTKGENNCIEILDPSYKVIPMGLWFRTSKATIRVYWIDGDR